MNSVQTRSAERALSGGTWLIVCGAMLYSILTVTPLMARHTADDWDWTAPILPLVVDAAVVIVVKLDDVLSRLGGHGGRWPVVLRWMTGLMTLALNTADSALKKDLVGVAVHSVAPLLLIVTAEASLAYRRAIAAAEATHKAAEDAERERRAQQRLADAERRRQDEREQRENAAALAREQREHEAALAREQAEREERRAREEREARERAEALEREARERREHEREQREHERQMLERQVRERAEAEQQERDRAAAREQREREDRITRERAALLERGPAAGKLDEGEARRIVTVAFGAGLSVRQAAELCGWSVGWVSGRYAGLRDPEHTGAPLAIASQ
ncbi:DUF2637 domain-containing protein [Streptomyces sp. SID5785]|uniref:DUF2637 domain-containing protein n=1 Tax=Streptomyces sp. SID5785 TaxID=2690309 RepID=UPI001361745A|nr:DUF2637 domain-containing protein [Streptomyces sp. SID5785]MZD09144.1 DUF2637 domain-containing protein [Streptomyces sp. SID5785]